MGRDFDGCEWLFVVWGVSGFVGQMKALFREECILTDFQGITPMQIGAKLAQAYTLLMTGSFREAKQIFMNVDTDPFLTVERKQKYIDMLDSADAIRYADAKDYIFTTDSENMNNMR